MLLRAPCLLALAAVSADLHRLPVQNPQGALGNELPVGVGTLAACR